MTAFPKTAYIRSPKLMRAYRAIPCQNCGCDDGTVCGAHANTAAMGKGRSIKASDEFAASLCHACHMAIDQGRDLSREQRAAIWQSAHRKTVATLVRLGLWPQDIPPPTTI